MSLVGVRSERGDVDQSRNAVVGSSAGDDASAVRVTDEDGRAVGKCPSVWCMSLAVGA
jgi:hypothetical protein